MSMRDLDLIPAGTVFTAEHITHYASPDTRSLEQAIAEADLLVSTPHSGAAIPEEIAEFLAPTLTKRLQYDYSDVATAAIVRRWAEIDSRIVAVINPHPRLIRDPNRAKPADIAGDLSAAIARVREAGPWQAVDLSGVDAIRPVTFSFYPILEIPEDEASVARLVQTFVQTAEQGLGVYERTRDELTERFLEKGLAQGGWFTRLSFHDTMNTTATREGAVNVARAQKDRLPAVVALSNRGDNAGERRSDAPANDHTTMNPLRLRLLAEAHRDGFDVQHDDAVQLNQPYLGSQEIIAARDRFRAISDEADAADFAADAVQAEFLREFLLGPAASAELQQPGTEWVQEDAAHIDMIAHACKRSWDEYRALR